MTREERDRALRELNKHQLDANGLLKDGCGFRVPMHLSDALGTFDDDPPPTTTMGDSADDDPAVRRYLSDAFPPSATLRNRPGFVGADATARDEIEKLYQLHDEEEASRWRNPTDVGGHGFTAHRQGDERTRHDSMTYDERVADREAAYREYQEWSENAWRHVR